MRAEYARLSAAHAIATTARSWEWRGGPRRLLAGEGVPAESLRFETYGMRVIVLNED